MAGHALQPETLHRQQRYPSLASFHLNQLHPDRPVVLFGIVVSKNMFILFHKDILVGCADDVLRLVD